MPWHLHTHTQDTVYVLEGRLRLFMRDPKEEVRLRTRRDVYDPDQPAAPGEEQQRASMTFFVLQGIGEYDYDTLAKPSARGAS